MSNGHFVKQFSYKLGYRIRLTESYQQSESSCTNWGWKWMLFDFIFWPRHHTLNPPLPCRHVLHVEWIEKKNCNAVVKLDWTFAPRVRLKCTSSTILTLKKKDRYSPSTSGFNGPWIKQDSRSCSEQIDTWISLNTNSGGRIVGA